MRYDFNKSCWSFLTRKRLWLHALIFVYGLLSVAVFMTQTTTAYFQSSETIGGSIKMASSFEEMKETPPTIHSDKNDISLDEQADTDSKDTIKETDVNLSDDSSRKNNDTSEETDSTSIEDISDLDNVDAEVEESRLKQNEAEVTEVDHDERE